MPAQNKPGGRQIIPPGKHAAPAPQPAKPVAQAVVIPTTKAPTVVSHGAATQIAANKAAAQAEAASGRSPQAAVARPGQAYPSTPAPAVVAAKAIAAAPQGAATHRPEADEMIQPPDHWSLPPHVAPAPQSAGASAIPDVQVVAAPQVTISLTCPVCKNRHTVNLG